MPNGSPRILSLKQPWAWAVATGKKKVENRSWSTPYRGTVYIHASRKLDRAALDWLRNHGVTPPSEFVHGAVVAVAEIADVVTKRVATAFAPWFFGPYGFVLVRIKRLRKPVPQKGRLGLARASDDLQRRVARALRATERSKHVNGNDQHRWAQLAHRRTEDVRLEVNYSRGQACGGASRARRCCRRG